MFRSEQSLCFAQEPASKKPFPGLTTQERAFEYTIQPRSYVAASTRIIAATAASL